MHAGARSFGMEDGEMVKSGEAFSGVQQDVVRDQYQALGPEERLLFGMGLNAFLSTVLMDATMCIRDVELSHMEGASDDSDDSLEEQEEAALMQRLEDAVRDGIDVQAE